MSKSLCFFCSTNGYRWAMYGNQKRNRRRNETLTRPLFFPPLAVGPLPPYLMQPTTAGQNGLDLSAQMYHSPSSSGLQLHHGHQHPQHRVGREMDDMMTDVGFNRSWDIFGGSFKPL